MPKVFQVLNSLSQKQARQVHQGYQSAPSIPHCAFIYCHYRTTLCPLTALSSTAIILFSTVVTEPPSIPHCAFLYCHYTFLYCRYRTTLRPLLHFSLLPLYFSLLPLQNHPPSPTALFSTAIILFSTAITEPPWPERNRQTCWRHWYHHHHR